MSPAWVRFLVYNTGRVQYRWTGLDLLTADRLKTQDLKIENSSKYSLSCCTYVIHRCRFVLAFSVLAFSVASLIFQGCEVLKWVTWSWLSPFQIRFVIGRLVSLWSTYTPNLKSLPPPVTKIWKPAHNVRNGVVWVVTGRKCSRDPDHAHLGNTHSSKN